MPQTANHTRKRLLYRAMHRGFKEADIIIGGFAREALDSLTEEELQAFEALLDVEDQELYTWILGKKAPDPAFEGTILNQLKAYAASSDLVRDLHKHINNSD